MLVNGQATDTDVIPVDSKRRTYVMVGSTTYKLNDGTVCEYKGESGILKSYKTFLGTSGELTVLVENDTLTVKDDDYFNGVPTETTVITTQTDDVDILYNALDLQRMYAMSVYSGFEKIANEDISVNGLNISITSCKGIIDGLSFFKKETSTVSIKGGLSQARIDLVVLRKSQVEATVEFAVIQGELGSTEIPTYTQNNLGLFEIPVCSVNVGAYVTDIQRADIKDYRNYLMTQKEKPVEDNGSTINPKQSRTAVLTNDAATVRDILDGLFEGQRLFVINKTSVNIAVDGNNIVGGGSIELWWQGGEWVRDKNLENHIADKNAHGSTPTPTEDRIAKYNTNKRLSSISGGVDNEVATAGELKTHKDLSIAHGATATPTENKIAMYDANKRLNSVSGGSGDNIATMTDIGTHNNVKDAHGSTVEATADRIVLRDDKGRSRISTPELTDEIANKGYVDTAKSSAISTASADATAKANKAKDDAISTASADATAKANEAKDQCFPRRSYLELIANETDYSYIDFGDNKSDIDYRARIVCYPETYHLEYVKGNEVSMQDRSREIATRGYAIPIGMIYPQYPNQSDPSTLWGGTWSDVSSTYASAFFRADGVTSGKFGSLHAEGLPNITGSAGGSNDGRVYFKHTSGAFELDSGGGDAETGGSSRGAYEGFTFDASRSSAIYGASEHVTPVNHSIKIWKKTAH